MNSERRKEKGRQPVIQNRTSVQYSYSNLVCILIIMTLNLKRNFGLIPIVNHPFEFDYISYC